MHVKLPPQQNQALQHILAALTVTDNHIIDEYRAEDNIRMKLGDDLVRC